MLGSTAESDDALQEAWLRISRAGVDKVENLEGRLTTVPKAQGRQCSSERELLNYVRP